MQNQLHPANHKVWIRESTEGRGHSLGQFDRHQTLHCSQNPESGQRRQSRRVTDMCAISGCPPLKGFACPSPARRRCFGQRSITLHLGRYKDCISEHRGQSTERAHASNYTGTRPVGAGALGGAGADTRLAAWELGGASQAPKQVSSVSSTKLSPA